MTQTASVPLTVGYMAPKAGPYLIKTGWDIPSPQFVHDNVALMEQTAHGGRPDRHAGRRARRCAQSDTPISAAGSRPNSRPWTRRHFSKLTHNFVMVYANTRRQLLLRLLGANTELRGPGHRGAAGGVHRDRLRQRVVLRAGLERPDGRDPGREPAAVAVARPADHGRDAGAVAKHPAPRVVRPVGERAANRDRAQPADLQRCVLGERADGSGSSSAWSSPVSGRPRAGDRRRRDLQRPERPADFAKIHAGRSRACRPRRARRRRP